MKKMLALLMALSMTTAVALTSCGGSTGDSSEAGTESTTSTESTDEESSGETTATTGGQIILSTKELRERGAIVDTVLCAIQRDPRATELLAAEGLDLRPAFTMEYIKEQAE